MTRKRSESAVAKDREWRERHGAYLKRGAGKPPRIEQTPEEKQLFEELRALPKFKLGRAKPEKRERDKVRFDMIRCILRYPTLREKRGLPAVADYDLMTCALGKYPGPGTNRKGSKQLQDFLAILKACDHPEVTPMQLYDSIREWRARRRAMSPPPP